MARYVQIQIQNDFIVSKYIRSIIHKCTKRLYQHIHKQFSEYIQCYGAKGAGNPVGFMGSLSDTLK